MARNKDQELFDAVLEGHVRKARRFIEDGLSVHTTCPCGCGQGLLIGAIIKRSVGLLRFLLERGANANATDRDGRTPLMEAARWGEAEILDLLLVAGADVAAAAQDGQTALDEAIYNGRAVGIERLVKAGASFDTAFQKERSALDWACGRGDEELASLLIGRGARLETRSYGGRRPLMAAAGGGHLGVVRLLLDRGARIDARDDRRGTALLYAAGSYGGVSDRVVRFLVEAGADVTLADKRKATALHAVAAYGQAGTMALLLDAGADPAARMSGGRTPLLHAAAFGHEAAVALLVERHPAGVDDTDRQGRTALALAAENGQRSPVEPLAAGGATIDRADSRGQTPFFLALASGHLKLAARLVALGADPNLRSGKGGDACRAAARHGVGALEWLFAMDGYTAPAPDRLGPVLVEAAGRGAEAVVSFLLEQGADPNAVDGRGGTALAAALAYGSCDDRYRRPRKLAEDKVGPTILRLLDAGAEPLVPQGQPPLLPEAMARRCPEVCRALVKAGVDVDPQPAPWMTPLAVAVAQGQVVLARMLLARAADPRRRGKRGRSAAELARESRKPAIRRLFDQ